jgi:hypothetical protein
MSALFYVPVPDAKEALLTFRFDNPFEHQHAAFGVMPGDVTAAQIGDLALMLFTANGHDSCPLFGSLPTSISHKGNWYGETLAPKFDREMTHRLFKAAAHTVWTPNISATCELYRRYKGDQRLKSMLAYLPHRTCKPGKKMPDSMRHCLMSGSSSSQTRSTCDQSVQPSLQHGRA